MSEAALAKIQKDVRFLKTVCLMWCVYYEVWCFSFTLIIRYLLLSFGVLVCEIGVGIGGLQECSADLRLM
ncbi:hypothetical protein EON63_18150 [archaeon]|nr:MAG: hypothetical protein EON63_18150 [archaeon]